MSLFLLPLHGQAEGLELELELPTQSTRFHRRPPPSAREDEALLGQGRAALVLLQLRVVQVPSVAVLGGV